MSRGKQEYGFSPGLQAGIPFLSPVQILDGMTPAEFVVASTGRQECRY